jgi:hypothetical protein
MGNLPVRPFEPLSLSLSLIQSIPATNKVSIAIRPLAATQTAFNGHVKPDTAYLT